MQLCRRSLTFKARTDASKERRFSNRRGAYQAPLLKIRSALVARPPAMIDRLSLKFNVEMKKSICRSPVRLSQQARNHLNDGNSRSMIENPESLILVRLMNRTKEVPEHL